MEVREFFLVPEKPSGLTKGPGDRVAAIILFPVAGCNA